MTAKNTILQHLTLDRHLQVNRYTSVFTDDDERVATFLIWNLSGQLIGYQQYRPDADKTKKNDPKEGRYYTHITKPDDKHRHLAVWGLETYGYRNDILCVTEGIFDACRLHNFWIPAVATMSNDPKHLRPWFSIIDKKKIGFLDNDSAGAKLAKMVDEKRVTLEKDLGDSTDEEILKMIGDLL